MNAIPRSLLAGLIVMAVFAVVAVVAQISMAQGTQDEAEVPPKDHCWDHYLCPTAIPPTPVPTPRPTYCDLFPIDPSCQRPPAPAPAPVPVPPVVVPPVVVPPVVVPPVVVPPVVVPTTAPVPTPTTRPVRPPNRPRPTSTPTPTPTPTPRPTPTLLPSHPCPDVGPAAERDISYKIRILHLNNTTMHPGECRQARIYLPGDLREGVNYTVSLRTTGGLAFDSECSGEPPEGWSFSGRSWQRRDYAIYACAGHSRGELVASLRQDQSVIILSGAGAIVTIAPRPRPRPRLRLRRPTPSPIQSQCRCRCRS